MGDVLLSFAEWKDRCLCLPNKFCYNVFEYKVFSSSAQRKVVLLLKEGACILEKRVEIIGAKNN